MKERDYLWCALHLWLDDEEEVARLCPTCRTAAEQERCPVCGALTSADNCGINPNFDLARFTAMQKGEQT